MKRTILFIIISSFSLLSLAQKTNYRLLIGTYTNTGKSEGINSYDVDLEKGVFTQKSLVKGISNPSYLAIAPDKKFVYSVDESSKGSAANAFSFDENAGKLTLINSSQTNGANPCFISVSDKHVITANYTGGSISVFGRNMDGSLTKLQQLIQHKGGSIDPKRQKEPHVHQVIFTPDKKYLVANDLGTDKVTVYKYNPNGTNNTLIPHDSIKVKAGSGPRHITFSKDGKRAYLLQEMDGTLSVLEMKAGKLKLLQETSVVKKNGLETGAADIHLSPDGNFLYATNRGTINDISCFAVKKDGTVSFVSQVSTGGNGPRNFAITPDGNFVLVANQKSDNIVVFKRDKKTGSLSDTGKRLEVGAPVCLVFY
ncbi:MAG: lactonase family protein [Paludibacter sp.]